MLLLLRPPLILFSTFSYLSLSLWQSRHRIFSEFVSLHRSLVNFSAQVGLLQMFYCELVFCLLRFIVVTFPIIRDHTLLSNLAYSSNMDTSTCVNIVRISFYYAGSLCVNEDCKRGLFCC